MLPAPPAPPPAAVRSHGLPRRPVLLAALLLPLGLGLLSARQQNTLHEPALAKCRAILKPWQFSSSVKAGHPAPTASLNWLHASVTGVVPTLADRQDIRLAMDQLQGILCPESGVANLRVPAHLESRRTGPTLILTGELPLPEILTQTTQLLTRAEPGLAIDGSAVLIDPAVLPVTLPTGLLEAASHPLLAPVWSHLAYAWPTIKIDYTAAPPRLSATFPDPGLRDAVIAALRQARPDLTPDTSAVTVNSTLPPADFTPPTGPAWEPPSWLKATWDFWTVYPVLRLRPDAQGIHLVDGTITNPTLLNNVLVLLKRHRPDLTFLKGNLTIRDGSLDTPLLLPATLENWNPPPWFQPLLTQLPSPDR